MNRSPDLEYTPPPFPRGEVERLAAVRRLSIERLPADRLEQIVCEVQAFLQVPIALISIVDADRQWFAASRGLDVDSTDRAVSFCGHAVAEDRTLVVPDALEDPRFAGNPLVVGPPFIRFYAGAVIHDPEGHPLGTVCGIDAAPRSLSSAELIDLLEQSFRFESLLEHDRRGLRHP